MTQGSSNTSGFEWKDLVYFLLGISAPIVVGEIFADNFYLAVGIVVVAFTIFIFIQPQSILKRGINVGGAVITAVLLIAIHNNSVLTKPTFEINFIGLPINSETAYYVTDSLIRTQGNLGAYDDFVLSPISVEVVPRYLGDKKYGNIILRVLGNSSSKDFVLWTDFDKSAQTQTVKIDLADILKISGIKQNREEESTNLMLGDNPFQETPIKFEVIRLAEPNTPFGSSKELLIRNTPWKQEDSVT